MKIPLFAASLFSLLIFAACDHTENAKTENPVKPIDMATARSEIDEANREFIELFNRNDSIGLANMFTTDGKSMEPNEPAFTGRRAIQTHYSIVMNAGANRLGLVTTGLWGDEKMLAEEGEFTFMDKEGKQLDKGKYIVLWKKEEGKWKLFRDCYNSDLPLRDDL